MKELGVDESHMFEMLEIEFSDFTRYEQGAEELPASVLYLASAMLTGDPMKLFEPSESTENLGIKKADVVS